MTERSEVQQHGRSCTTTWRCGQRCGQRCARRVYRDRPHAGRRHRRRRARRAARRLGRPVAADPDPNVFLTWAWASTWWQHFGAGRDDRELHVVVVRDGATVVGLAPLFRSRVGSGPLASTVLQRLNPDAGDYGGMLLGRRADEAVALLVDHLGAQLQRDVDVVVLTRLASDARFTALLGDELVRHAATIETVVDQLGDACLFTDVRGDFDLRKQAKKHKIRQRTRRLERAARRRRVPRAHGRHARGGPRPAGDAARPAVGAARRADAGADGGRRHDRVPARRHPGARRRGGGAAAVGRGRRQAGGRRARLRARRPGVPVQGRVRPRVRRVQPGPAAAPQGVRGRAGRRRGGVRLLPGRRSVQAAVGDRRAPPGDGHAVAHRAAGRAGPPALPGGPGGGPPPPGPPPQRS